MGAALISPVNHDAMLLQNGLLCEELLVNIAEYLAVKDLCRMRRICTHSNAICTTVLKSRFECIRNALLATHFEHCAYRYKIPNAAAKEHRQPTQQDMLLRCGCNMTKPFFDTLANGRDLLTAVTAGKNAQFFTIQQLRLMNLYLCSNCQQHLPLVTDPNAYCPDNVCYNCKYTDGSRPIDCVEAFIRFDLPESVYCLLPGCIKNRPSKRKQTTTAHGYLVQIPVYISALTNRKTEAAYEDVTTETVMGVVKHIYGVSDPMERLSADERSILRVTYLKRMQAIRAELKRLIYDSGLKATPSEMSCMRTRALYCNSVKEVLEGAPELRRYLSICRLSQFIRDKTEKNEAERSMLLDDLQLLSRRKRRKGRQHL